MLVLARFCMVTDLFLSVDTNTFKTMPYFFFKPLLWEMSCNINGLFVYRFNQAPEVSLVLGPSLVAEDATGDVETPNICKNIRFRDLVALTPCPYITGLLQVLASFSIHITQKFHEIRLVKLSKSFCCTKIVASEGTGARSVTW